jgi:lysozyme family protein
MANFIQALQRVLAHEGGHVNHPDDPGGETYYGIARRYHSDWEGWLKIDEYKSDPEFPRVLYSDHTIKGWVRDFYRRHYWDNIKGDTIASQDLANELMDISVNMGTRRAIYFLQRGLNVLNRREQLWPDLNVDGIRGAKTGGALSKCEAIHEGNYLLKLLVLQRGAHYIRRALEHEASEEFIRGWLNRTHL